MKKKRLKKGAVISIIMIIVILIGLTIFFTLYNMVMKPVSKNDQEITVVVEPGSNTSDIAKLLKDQNLIKNETVFIYYLKIRKADNIYAATYQLNKNMNMVEITDALLKGGMNADEIVITFLEGINIRKIASIIAEETNNKESDVFDLLKDKNYINELIETYWFITNDIKNKNIYFPIEGYLFPDTYHFNNKDVTVKEIFERMLRETDELLTTHKEEIEKSKRTVHEILTLASMVELEVAEESARKDVVSLFMNRLDVGMSLGSDVTTYYAFNVDMAERELTIKELNTFNPYNTRGPEMIGKLPVGPIASPSKISIEAAINPNHNDYLFFATDKNGKVYFTKTINEHDAIIDQLIKEGLWYEW